MNRRGLAQGVIDALPEPAFLLDREGALIGVNRAGRGVLGSGAASGALADSLASPPQEFRRYIARCAQTTTPLPGVLSFRIEDGARRFRVHCARLGGGMGEVVLLLRCKDPRGDRFSILAERVRHLDAELRARVREKAVLREALDENRNLMRELQHRVKNNIQMMISLLSMSAAGSGSPEIRGLIGGLKDRFRALATTQDLIYESQSASIVSARELLGRLARSLGESTEAAVDVQADMAEIWLPQESAHCLALILNELVTNSIKHGLRGGAGTIRVSLGREGGQLRLEVRDEGQGYPPLEDLPRSSGLKLIRGLCRQIGAGLDLGNDGGARSVVSFPEPEATGDPGQGGAAGRHSALDLTSRVL